MDYLLLVVGIFLLYTGAQWLVTGSASLAIRLGITPLLVGLTVVAFGTSAPELFVSIRASFSNSPDIAFGNVVGSNIGNVGLILALTCILQPLRVPAQIIRFDSPYLIWSNVLLLFLIFDRKIDRMEGLLLFSLLLVYVIYSIRQSQNVSANETSSEDIPTATGHLGKDLFLIVAGLVTLIVGSDLLVDSAVSIARRFELSEAVIGLTLVALGTSLPELATSIVAAFKKEADIALGNVIGSNIFNLLSVLGLASMVKPISSAGMSTTDLTLMLFSSVILLPLMWRSQSLGRFAGFILFSGYAVYLFSLF